MTLLRVGYIMGRDIDIRDSVCVGGGGIYGGAWGSEYRRRKMAIKAVEIKYKLGHTLWKLYKKSKLEKEKNSPPKPQLRNSE